MSPEETISALEWDIERARRVIDRKDVELEDLKKQLAGARGDADRRLRGIGTLRKRLEQVSASNKALRAQIEVRRELAASQKELIAKLKEDLYDTTELANQRLAKLLELSAKLGERNGL